MQVKRTRIPNHTLATYGHLHCVDFVGNLQERLVALHHAHRRLGCAVGDHQIAVALMVLEKPLATLLRSVRLPRYSGILAVSKDASSPASGKEMLHLDS